MPPIWPMTVGIAVEMTAVSRLTRKVATKSARVTSRRPCTSKTLTGSRGRASPCSMAGLGGQMPSMRTWVLGLVAAWLALAPAAYAEPDTVQVFFSRDPDSLNDFTAVFAQPRTVPGGAGLIEQTVAAHLAGPTAGEQAAGYFSDFRNLIVGTASTCKGQDFTLMVTLGIATLQLCRATSSAGIGQDARAESEITA